MAQKSRMATSFLIIPDTHNFDFKDAAPNSHPFQLPTPKADRSSIVGGMTELGSLYRFEKALEMLARK